ncbi:hypothetical protein Tco_1017423 [Tanacetum coccineum]|uniref:Retrovirus-related Pol polyprotein from transposon TNT 1-94-like beta-barrel domain-containing protein n=1 Tax=Tanacetum coccineum TaxID=301880 RepID=A0ABQ5FSU0_9ASTR
MVPRVVLMKSDLVSINTTRHNISKTAILVNTTRQVNIAHLKTIVNTARPMSYLSNIAHSTVKRPIHKNTAFKNSNINQRVNTVRGKKFNTASLKVVVNAVKGNNFNAVKASACWVWKSKHKVLDHGNPQIDLQDKGVIDSGCSRHMTGNMSYLTDYEEIDGGYVAFGGNPKGGKITGKCTIKTGTKASDSAGQARKETKPVKDYILLPLWTADPSFSQDPKSSHDDGSKPSSDDGKKVDEDPRKDSKYKDQEKEDNVNSTNNVNAASTNEVNVIGAKTSIELPFDPNMHALEDINIFDFSRGNEDDDAETDMNNLDTTIQKQKPKKPKRKDTQIPQSSGPTEHVADEAVYKELDDNLVRVATTASSLEAEQDNDHTSEDEIISLKRRVKKPEQKKRSRTHGQKRARSATKDVNLTVDEVTLAQALVALKSVNPSSRKKEVWVEPLKKKDQISFDKQEAIRLQAEFVKEERLAKEKDEANVALTEEWDDIQAKVDADYQLTQRLQE